MRWFSVLLTVCAAWALACTPPHPHPADRDLGPQKEADWPTYGADLANTKFSPLDQIHAGNVADLRIAWRWTSPDQEILAEHPIATWIHEATPLAVDGILYTATSLSQIAAIDGQTGDTLWVHDPGTWKRGSPPNMGFVHRGVAYWRGSSSLSRIFVGTGDGFLLALDPETGAPAEGFGDRGRVDLTTGLRRPVDRDLYGVTSPPIVCGEAVIVGSSISDDPLRPGMPPGDVRGFDPRTGETLWTFHTIPQDGPERQTWGQDAWRRVGNTNAWTILSCDPELGLVYLPIGTPTNDYYGGDRPGDNLFADSLVALDAETGERRWHFQAAHHGLWDYDLPAAPNLVDFELEGRPVRAVAQVTKQAFCFVLDRATGEPIWPIEERPVPASDVPGEAASPTQPYPTRPPAFDRQGITEDDLIDFTPELYDEALEIFDRFDSGPLYTPPSEIPILVLPGPVGGASWAGAAFDPRTGRLFVPSVTKPSLLSLIEPGAEAPGHRYRGFVRLNPPGPRGLPLVRPPYGRVTAIDLPTGEIAWTQAIGRGPRDHPALAGLDLPPLGWPRRSFVLLTGSLLFVAQQGDWRLGGLNDAGNAVLIDHRDHQPMLRALDPADGQLIAEIPLPANATGSPMTYSHRGQQTLVLATGGGQQPAELIALRLP